MSLDYADLDTATRTLMVEEIELDIANRKMNPSSWLSGSGQLEWQSLLLDAARAGDDMNLADQLRSKRRLNPTQIQNRSGNIITCKMPENASEILAEREFNRFYIRAICRRAIAERVACVIIYRARSKRTPRSTSQQILGCTRDPSTLLMAFRAATQSDNTPILGLLAPNSGLSIRLP